MLGRRRKVDVDIVSVLDLRVVENEGMFSERERERRVFVLRGVGLEWWWAYGILFERVLVVALDDGARERLLVIELPHEMERRDVRRRDLVRLPRRRRRPR